MKKHPIKYSNTGYWGLGLNIEAFPHTRAISTAQLHCLRPCWQMHGVPGTALSATPLTQHTLLTKLFSRRRLCTKNHITLSQGNDGVKHTSPYKAAVHTECQWKQKWHLLKYLQSTIQETLNTYEALVSHICATSVTHTFFFSNFNKQIKSPISLIHQYLMWNGFVKKKTICERNTYSFQNHMY